MSPQKDVADLPSEQPQGLTVTFDLELLDEIATTYGLDPRLLRAMIELEARYVRAGRRRGLFPALRKVVAEACGDAEEAS